MEEKTVFRDSIGIALLCALLFGFMLGNRPLSAPDEGRYTEIPREMVQSGDYITPRLNGVKYFEKPPLMYWLAAVSIKGWGVSEKALRFWPAFFGFLTVLGVYATGRMLYNRRAGWYAAGILATSTLFYAHTRILILDMLVSAFISLGLFSFLASTQENFSKKARFVFLMGFFVASAGAVMAKGLIGAVLPGGIILTWALVARSWQPLKSAFNPLGILLFLVLTAPWHILASLKNPEFFDFYFIHEHFTRYLEKVHNRYQPFWFFIPLILLGFFPWTTVVLKAFWQAIGQSVKGGIQAHIAQTKEDLFLGIWACFIFLFFSFSHSKLIPYILPVFPPLAVMGGSYLAKTFSEAKKPARGLSVSSLLLVLGLPAAAHWYGLTSYPFFLGLLGALIAVLGIIGWLAWRYPYHKIFPPLMGLAAVFLTLLNGAWPYLDTRSVKEIAWEILRHQKPGERVVAFERYYQDLPPYLNQTIMVVEWRGELDFGMKQEDTSAWMLTREDFFKLSQRPEKLYIVSRKESLPTLRQLLGNLKILKETTHDVLVVTH